MLESIINNFLLFIIYSFLGWIMEVICIYGEFKKWVNRGFLIGPICPIYGYGVLGILILIGQDTSDFLGVFLKSILICSILEYLTSYFMEKLFKARWWDYSKRRFNINGRICLETMIPFGILGTLIVYIINPFFLSLITSIPKIIRISLAIILFAVYLTDNIISLVVMSKIKGEIKRHDVDSTEILKEKLNKWLENNSYLFRRIKKAFPKFKILRISKKKEGSKNANA